MPALLHFIDHLRTDPVFAGQIAHFRILPEREAAFAEPDPPLA